VTSTPHSELDGEVPDDSTIANECRLFRRISAQYVTAEGEHFRISSQAFNNSSDGSGMSVWLEDTMQELGLSPADALVGHDHTWLVALTAGNMRHERQGVVRTPEPAEPAHGEVLGSKASSRRGRIRDQATWAISPSAG
jgi:hypothetical protein